ncbi:MAG TPA: flagellar basal body rod protein FlgC [Gammaproteobacteria bacterium]|nr:flagellar basal body rod protein FlgC [Gammaproteobacteria bacterium]
MDYYSAFEISASGMAIEKLRLDTLALNLANANTSRTEGGSLYQPLRVVARARTARDFDAQLGGLLGTRYPAGVELASIETVNVAPRQVYDPGHPDADERGFVAFPNVNPVSEMVALIAAVRGYEANVRAMNAAKSMALSALEIGRQR